MHAARVTSGVTPGHAGGCSRQARNMVPPVGPVTPPTRGEHTAVLEAALAVQDLELAWRLALAFLERSVRGRELSR